MKRKSIDYFREYLKNQNIPEMKIKPGYIYDEKKESVWLGIFDANLIKDPVKGAIDLVSRANTFPIRFSYYDIHKSKIRIFYPIKYIIEFFKSNKDFDGSIRRALFPENPRNVYTCFCCFYTELYKELAKYIIDYFYIVDSFGYHPTNEYDYFRCEYTYELIDNVYNWLENIQPGLQDSEKSKALINLLCYLHYFIQYIKIKGDDSIRDFSGLGMPLISRDYILQDICRMISSFKKKEN